MKGLPQAQRNVFAAVLLGVPLSAWGATYPPNTLLQVGPVVGIIVLAWLALRRWPLSNASVGWIAGFLLLHLFAARWTYSSVPYDQWSSALTGISIDGLFHFQRNMFDRLVHFAFGLCAVVPMLEIGGRYLKLKNGVNTMAMLLFVLGSGALYEIFEWLLAVSMDPVSSEAYNGQQGDPFDAQKDMLIASIGSLAGLAFAYRRKVAVLDRLASIRTMTPTDVAITPGQTLVREDHDR